LEHTTEEIGQGAIRYLRKVAVLRFLGFALLGLIFSVVILIWSLFKTGRQAEFLRLLSLAPLLVMSTVGLIHSTMWLFVMVRRLRRAKPSSATGNRGVR